MCRSVVSMKFNFDDKTKNLIKASVIAGTILMLIFYGVSKLDETFQLIEKFFGIILPFIFGGAIAFLVMPLCNKIQYQWLAKVKLKTGTKRKIAAFSSIGVLLLLIGSLITLISPQLYKSIVQLSQTSADYLNNLDKVIGTSGQNQFANQIVNAIWPYSEEIFKSFFETLKNSLPHILSYSASFLKVTVNMIIGIFIAVYIMLDKERFLLQFKKIAFAIFPKEKVESSIGVAQLTTKMFNAFVIGKSLDSLIIGILCFIGMTLMGMDYVLLISVVIGVTNMIPIFGPFIGAIPGFIILFIFNPTQALMFAIWILILQQFDGNILGPYILGDSVGLPSLWVMFAIIVGGGFFGIVGMFVGVPLFAVVYILIKNIVEQRLEQKKVKL